MKKGDQLCIVRAEIRTSGDIGEMVSLIAALATMGATLDADCPYMETREIDSTGRGEKRIITWVLSARTQCGRHETKNLIKAWNTPQWVSQNQEHPFAYVLSALRNRKAVEAHMAGQAPVAVVRKGHRIALIPFDTSKERREWLLKQLQP